MVTLPPLPAVDLSLYINEEQLKTRRKRSSPSKRKKKEESSGESGVESEDESHDSEGEEGEEVVRLRKGSEGGWMLCVKVHSGCLGFQ